MIEITLDTMLGLLKDRGLTASIIQDPEEKHSPEDVLQATVEKLFGEDVLLDLDRSTKWRQVHGPDGVAGLCDGQAGIVVCRDGGLTLLRVLTTEEVNHYVGS